MLAAAAWRTLSVALAALVIASLIAQALAILIGLHPLLERAVRPLASVIQVTPVIAIALSAAIYIGWMYFIQAPQQERQQAALQQQQAQQQTQQQAGQPAAPANQPAAAAPQDGGRKVVSREEALRRLLAGTLAAGAYGKRFVGGISDYLVAGRQLGTFIGFLVMARANALSVAGWRPLFEQAGPSLPAV